MNCDEFYGRLQRQLDQRVPPETDPQLASHAQDCNDCRAQLEVWRSVSCVIPGSIGKSEPAVVRATRSSRVDPIGRWSFVGLAASIVLLLMVVQRDSGSDSSPSVTDRKPSARLVDPSARGAGDNVGDLSPKLALNPMDPTVWWERVHGREWFDRTLPTVQSMRDGVAPLGRTLMRAVTILTIGGDDQTS